VKDSGPGDLLSESLQTSANKINRMRSVLRDLEKKARSSSSASSRIPRRSIKFNSTTVSSEAATLASRAAPVSSEAAATITNTDDNAENARLREELATERNKNKELELVNCGLETTLAELSGRLTQALESDARKETSFRQMRQQGRFVQLQKII
jgi:hypothetical protein